jgi:predicted deacylase
MPTQAQPRVVDIEIGRSGQDRPITAVRIGNGPRKLVLVGATHGYPERNTYQLAEQLAEYFRAHPDEVPASVRLYIVPLINPDGLALQTRFNAAGIDLNRNMNTNFDACDDNDWNITVQGARGIVSDTGGPYPDSEPETRVIRDFLLDASAVVFFHSDGGDVFPAACEHAPSIRLAEVYAQQSGYRYDRYWQNYLITGGMHDWAASIGIAAVIPELFTGVDPDYAANLAAVQAVLSRADELLPAPEDQQVDGVVVPALIWRYWRAHGGEAIFGRPIAAAERFGALTRQAFTNAVIEVHPDQADTPYLVQMALLGRRMVDPALQQAQSSGDGYFFPETGHAVNGPYAHFWDEAGGVAFLGFPLSEAQQRGGQLTQYFERAIVTYDTATATARLEPLGWYTLVADRASAPTQANQIR